MLAYKDKNKHLMISKPCAMDQPTKRRQFKPTFSRLIGLRYADTRKRILTANVPDVAETLIATREMHAGITSIQPKEAILLIAAARHSPSTANILKKQNCRGCIAILGYSMHCRLFLSCVVHHLSITSVSVPSTDTKQSNSW